jgi:hypothetical protein
VRETGLYKRLQWKAARLDKPRTVRKLSLQQELHAAPVRLVIDRQPAAFVKGAKHLARGVGVTSQGGQLRPTAICLLLAQQRGDGVFNVQGICVGPVEAHEAKGFVFRF